MDRLDAHEDRADAATAERPPATRRAALLLEVDGLTAERVRQMLRAEGVALCHVEDLALFHRLRRSHVFDVFVIGVNDLDALERSVLPVELEPLIVLAPASGRSGWAPFRIAFPQAVLVDRALRDPDALRRVLRPRPEHAERRDSPDAVRRAFAPFGLSERQLEVLAHALLGDTGTEIATKLFISELTVRNHLHAIYERVGVTGRRQLLGRFVRGLIEANA
jgi:DNA-binding CsgD family transcriptional regulator